MNDYDAMPMETPPTFDLSIVVPVYRNEETLETLAGRLTDTLKPLAVRFEIVFVNDASPDRSQEVLCEIARKHTAVEIVELNENIGQNRAVLTGLTRASGRFALIMDADLQDPPEAIPALWRTIQETGCAAVFARRRGKYESFPRRLSSYIFKTGLRLVCGIPRDAGLFVLIGRNMIKRLLAFDTQNPYVVAMIACTGLPTVSIPVPRAMREKGTSAYTLGKRLRVGWNAGKWVLAWKYDRLKNNRSERFST